MATNAPRTSTATEPPTSETASAPRVFNGFDTTVLGGLVELLRQDRSVGRVTFLAASRWDDGARVSTGVKGYRIDGEMHHQDGREHVMVSDEPVEFGAADTAPAPPEQLMAALGSCIASTASAYAALKGVRLSRIEVAVEGDVDLHGFAGLDANVRPGLREIRTAITIAGDASEETLRELALLGYQFSVVRDTIQKGVPVKPSIIVAD